jgi:hypothetical protein
MAKKTIPKFNLVEDQKAPVYDEKSDKCEVMPVFPAQRTASDRWAPVSGRPSLGEVKDVWEKADNMPERVTKLWSRRLGLEKDLDGSRPRILLERFANTVPAAPMIAQGAK